MALLRCQDCRAISGPLTPAKRGLSRSLTDGLLRRSSSAETRIAQIPKLTVRPFIASGGDLWLQDGRRVGGTPPHGRGCRLVVDYERS